MFEEYTLKKIWIDRGKIDYEELAIFAGTRRIYDYLMKFARSKDHFVYRYNAIEILGKMKGLIPDDDLLIFRLSRIG